ncbi:MAG: retropepsin-like aspartic protease family protein [Acidiferrobacterales bacterium]
MKIQVRKLILASAVVVFAMASQAMAASGSPVKIKLLAIFENKVIATINGQRAVLVKDRIGPSGVTLRSCDTWAESAKIEVSGKIEEIPLGYVMSGGSKSSANGPKQRITLYSGENGFFHADGYINNTPVRFLVDTGANTIAMNAQTAKRIGLDYRRGQQGVAVTASGYAPTYLVDLEQVEVGNLKLRHVEASVIEGRQPETPLLGMSFLGSFDMRREGDQMELIQR